MGSSVWVKERATGRLQGELASRVGRDARAVPLLGGVCGFTWMRRRGHAGSTA